MSIDNKSSKQQLLIWASIITLSLCLVYAVYSLASSITQFSLVDKILFGSVGIAVWAIGVFFLLARLGFYLEMHMVDGYYEPSLAAGLLVTVVALAISVVLVILGFVGIIAIAPITFIVLGVSLLFSSEFFGLKRVPFSVRLIILASIIGIIVGAVGFLA